LTVTLKTTTDKDLMAQIGGIGGVTGVETGLIAPVQQLADRVHGHRHRPGR
jgi:hypothetical protein